MAVLSLNLPRVHPSKNVQYSVQKWNADVPLFQSLDKFLAESVKFDGSLVEKNSKASNPLCYASRFKPTGAIKSLLRLLESKRY